MTIVWKNEDGAMELQPMTGILLTTSEIYYELASNDEQTFIVEYDYD